MAVSISQKNDLKKDVDQTRRFLANSHRRRSTYELLIPNEDGNGPQTSCCPQNHATQSSLGRISEKVLKKYCTIYSTDYGPSPKGASRASTSLLSPKSVTNIYVMVQHLKISD